MIPVRILWGLLLGAGAALAQSRVEAQLLADGADARALPAFDAPHPCTGAASWVDAVLERLVPEARELARRQLPGLVEAVQVSADGKQASLRLRGADAARVVVGKGCREVLTDAALIAARAFDSRLEPKHAIVRNGTEPNAALEPSRASGAMLETQSQAKPSEALDRSRPLAIGPPRPIQLPAPPLRAAMGAGAAAHTGLAPWPAAVLDGMIELTWPQQGWSLRGRGSFGLARALVRDRGARFEYVGGGLDVCPIVFGAHLDWQWRSCLAYDLGRVHASGDAEPGPRTATDQRLWWSALGLVTRLQSPRVYGVRFELEGGASVPLLRRNFELDDPNAAVFETPALAASARLGLQIPLE